MKTFYLIIIVILISHIACAQSIPPADSCALYVNGKTHYYGVWPGCNSTYISSNSGCLYKPVIILNGFDPDSHRHLYVPHDDCLTDDGLTFEKCIYCVANEHGMAESLRSAGYDIVILDFADLDVIQKQANVLQALITELKQKMQVCNNQHEFVIIGPSSGGLITRYALAEMEENNQDHNTRLYISFDAPHRGANVPLSLQFLINFMHDVENIDAINMMYDYLHSDPSNQLLIYKAPIGTNQLIINQFIQFYNTIKSLNFNGYPNVSRNVAISNGSSNSNHQGFLQNQKLFNIEGKVPVVFKIELEGWSVPNQNYGIVFKGKYRKLINFHSVNNYVANTIPLDNIPGGKGNFISQLVASFDEPIEVNENISINIAGDCIQNPCDNQFECFIPVKFHHVVYGITPPSFAKGACDQSKGRGSFPIK